MRVTSVRLYPVKSMGGLAVDTVRVEPWGLAGDRRFGVVDESGDKITARELHDLLGFHATPAADGSIRITDRTNGSIDVAAPVGGERIAVNHSRQGTALAVPAEVDRWLSSRLHRGVRLVWQDDPRTRSISEDHGGRPGEHLSLADDGPLLLVSQASLAQLNRWIADDAELADPPDLDPDDLSGPSAPTVEPLDIVRFRPNVVVDGEEPFAEDSWQGVRIGEIYYRTTMICDRCVMTTFDPQTLIGGKEPIRTLARHRRWDRKTWFGIRLVPASSGQISLGDVVEPR